ncbi:hypothetical protein NQ318_013162 [Aromia moschata]|uniref:Uncharacterized protein n=1 Tax=Aromia moschata TaxID=1265417 RepID=A0AAV8Y1H9_9CUCU|nr:hypothetical protein NQ318_013162 [Aromia moschata]
MTPYRERNYFYQCNQRVDKLRWLACARCGDKTRTQKQVCEIFNTKYPDRRISQSTNQLEHNSSSCALTRARSACETSGNFSHNRWMQFPEDHPCTPLGDLYAAPYDFSIVESSAGNPLLSAGTEPPPILLKKLKFEKYEVCKLSNETGNVAPDLAALRRRDFEERSRRLDDFGEIRWNEIENMSDRTS